MKVQKYPQSGKQCRKLTAARLAVLRGVDPLQHRANCSSTHCHGRCIVLCASTRMGTVVNIALREDASPEDRLRAMFQVKENRKPSCNVLMSCYRKREYGQQYIPHEQQARTVPQAFPVFCASGRSISPFLMLS